MMSFQIAISPNRRAATRFIGEVRRELQKAYVEEQQQRGLSQSEIARLLKIHRSVINRELKGVKDITLGRVAELAWALGRKARFSLEEAPAVVGSNSAGIIAHPIVAQGANTPAHPTCSTSSALTFNAPPNVRIITSAAA
ncbi:helix-turn-helix domain-containing protein [Bradyrhizobium sp. HKCCYLS3077]|uniref:helix-turn-helix domain-containing protein n=1 Tax=Bradyrhizobium sp. HKCCYLS3077 TaxID=3420761 RepID=UPI003EBF25B7